MNFNRVVKESIGITTYQLTTLNLHKRRRLNRWPDLNWLNCSSFYGALMINMMGKRSLLRSRMKSWAMIYRQIRRSKPVHHQSQNRIRPSIPSSSKAHTQKTTWRTHLWHLGLGQLGLQICMPAYPYSKACQCFPKWPPHKMQQWLKVPRFGCSSIQIWMVGTSGKQSKPGIISWWSMLRIQVKQSEGFVSCTLSP